MQYLSLLDSIINDYRAIFRSMLLFSLCYFFDIKEQLSKPFYPQTDKLTKTTKQHNIGISLYLC